MRERGTRLAGTVVVLGLVLATSAAGGGSPRLAPLYAPDSPLNTPIGASPALDPNSAAYVDVMVDVANSNKGIVVAVKRWSTPVYFAKRNTPRRNVRLTASWAPRRWLVKVPIPSSARPDPAGDGHMTVIDYRSGCEFDFYEAVRNEDGSWSAGWANRIELDTAGIFPHGLSARGSGFALGAGIIRPGDLKAGVIRHALAFSYPYPREGGPVAPATASDGDSSGGNVLPEGARLQLNPAFDVSTLPEAWQRTVARALQRYGMLLVDDGANSIGLYAVNPQSWPNNPYPWGDQPYAFLPAEVVANLRVLRLPRQVDTRERIAPSRCARYR